MLLNGNIHFIVYISVVLVLIKIVLMITIKFLFGELHLNLWQLINRLWICLMIFHFILVKFLSIRLFSLCYIILLRVVIDVKDT